MTYVGTVYFLLTFSQILVFFCYSCGSWRGHTSWFMNCRHYCTVWSPRSLWWKKSVLLWVLFWIVTELGFFNYRKRPPMNRAPQVTLRNLQPAGTWIGSGSCESQLAVFTTERQRELLPAVAFSKICLKQRTVQTEGNLMKFNRIYTTSINLLGTLLVYYFVSFISIIFILCSLFQAAINL